MSKLVDLKDQTFGRLTVLNLNSTVGTSGQRRGMWLCRCTCGGLKTVASSLLRSGMVRSCGCLRREVAAESMRRNRGGAAGGRAKQRGKTIEDFFAPPVVEVHNDPPKGWLGIREAASDLQMAMGIVAHPIPAHRASKHTLFSDPRITMNASRAFAEMTA